MEARLSQEVLRIIDANVNRAGEGLRYLEEMARMALDDAALTQQLKDLRHAIVVGDWAFQVAGLNARDSVADVGADLEASGGTGQSGLPATLVANSRRVQESLRVLEELARLPGSPLDTDRLRRARFTLYTVEKELLSRLLRQDKLARLRGLYAVIDLQFLKGRDYLEVARQTIRGGATAIQLRGKESPVSELLPIARALREACAGAGVLFIINDRLDLALAVDADGVHLGQDDLPATEARRLLPIGKLLGISATTLDQALAAQADGAGYLGVGAIFPTGSKEVTDLTGLDGLRRIRQAVALPIVAIGGITQENMGEVVAAGADAVAVISAVLDAPDIEKASRDIAGRFKK